jgi:hypothetical protein
VEFAEDAMTTDPHEVGETLKQEGGQRFRERDRVNRDLKPKGIAASTVYTFDAGAAGPEVAEAAWVLVERANRRVWSTRSRTTTANTSS